MYTCSYSQSQDRLSATVETIHVRWWGVVHGHLAPNITLANVSSIHPYNRMDDSRGPDILKLPQAILSRPLSRRYSMEDVWNLNLSFAEVGRVVQYVYYPPSCNVMAIHVCMWNVSTVTDWIPGMPDWTRHIPHDICPGLELLRRYVRKACKLH